MSDNISVRYCFLLRVLDVKKCICPISLFYRREFLSVYYIFVHTSFENKKIGFGTMILNTTLKRFQTIQYNSTQSAFLSALKADWKITAFPSGKLTHFRTHSDKSPHFSFMKADFTRIKFRVPRQKIALY